MKDISLKPCPFCKSKSGQREEYFYNPYYNEFSCWICCEDCNSRGPSVVILEKLDVLENGDVNTDKRSVYLSFVEAKLKWNARGFVENNDRYSLNKDIVLHRDNNVCSICGNSENLVVHHIDGYKKGVLSNNQKEKLITLCRSCHSKVHYRKINIPKEVLEKIGYFDD